jgi:DNA-binding NarL/FixJ family response regulator
VPEIESPTHRFVLAEPHAFVRSILRQVIVERLRSEVVCETASGAEALRECRQGRTHILILELALAELEGAEVIALLRHDSPSIRTIVFTGCEHGSQMEAALNARPHGFVHKNNTLTAVQAALSIVSKGGFYYCPVATRIAEDIDANRRTSSLGAMERVILRLIAESAPNKVIADRLGLSTKSIEHRRAKIMRKLNVRDVASLTRTAIRMGLIES